MATRLTKYLTENGYINTSVQKGGIPGISGCLEHATMIWEAIQRAKSEKLNLDVVWLDLANTYGSVPHGMIQQALRMYHVPEDIQVMLDDDFSGFRMRFSTSDYTTNWINLEVGIAMGCTISPILFVMAMEVILKAAEAEWNKPIPKKKEKYLDLTKELEESGYRAKIMPTEIGARGFAGSSAYDLLSKLSISGNKRTKTLKLLAETAENSSRWIWCRRLVIRTPRAQYISQAITGLHNEDRVMSAHSLMLSNHYAVTAKAGWAFDMRNFGKLGL
ncbi:reverse transcriptase [Elysia marginata]|uniref:Reverse transcriptase n=1 Tax=Elysia marginata TaxID=1093978 RepID=A0AAV4GN93_9GAST|nr:reverse transcriptase [Elysia marginata]